MKGASEREGLGNKFLNRELSLLTAEVVSFADLVAAGSKADAKAAGKVRMEGKDYVMADGDVVEFRFNV